MINKGNKIITLLFIIPLFLLSISLVSAEEFAFNNLEKPTLGITNVINYTTKNVNNSQYLQGYTPTTLKDWIEGLFDSVYCQLTGCEMTGNISTTEWFNGKFNWTSGDAWNLFDGSELLFNETKVGDNYYNKSEVDAIASAIAFDFFFTNHTSDIAGHYNFIETDLGHPETSLTTPALATGSHNIFNFTTEIGVPEFNKLREGIYDTRLHLFKTGTKSVTITPKLYNISSDGLVKNLLITFETSVELTTIDATYDLHGILNEEVILGDGERLHMEFVADVGASGGNPTVTLDMEGTTDTHMSIETSSDAFEKIFVRIDGTNNLTGNLTVTEGINIGIGGICNNGTDSWFVLNKTSAIADGEWCT